MSPRWLLSALLGLVAVGAGACSERPTTQVFVVFDAEEPLRESVRRVEIEVDGRAPSEDRFERVSSNTVSLPLPTAFPFSLGLAPAGGDASREFRLLARAYNDSDAEVGRVRALSTYVEGEQRELRLVFEACCRFRVCGGSQTCRACTCVDATVAASSLPVYPQMPPTPTPRDGGVLMDGSVDGDADADGFSDREEGRFDMPGARDTDLDGRPDYLDRDSDNDGLSDDAERRRGTSPIRADTDGDTAPDLVEISVGTDPRASTSSPAGEGIFAFLMGPDGPPVETFVVTFAVPSRTLDVLFLFDTTDGMEPELSRLMADLADGMFGGCTEGIAGALQCRRPRTEFSLVSYGDFPVVPYGTSESVPLTVLSPSSPDLSVLRSAVPGLIEQPGADSPEALIPALWAATTGGALGSFLPEASCPSGRYGAACLREAAVPIVVVVSDAGSHNGPGGIFPYDEVELGFEAPSYEAALAALTDAGVRLVGIGIDRSGQEVAASTEVLRALGVATGSVDDERRPTIYELERTGAGTPDPLELGGLILDGLAVHERLQARARVVDVDATDLDAASELVSVVRATTSPGLGSPCESDLSVADRDDDGAPETFRDVTEGQVVCWNVDLRNTSVPASSSPQVFEARFEVRDEREEPLATRRLVFVVPPEIPEG